MRKIVVNSTPLIALAKAGKLELLKAMYGRVIIPEAVYKEVRWSKMDCSFQAN